MGESDAMIQQYPPREHESAPALEPVLLTQELELSSAQSPETAKAEPTTEPVLAQELESVSTLEQKQELAPALVLGAHQSVLAQELASSLAHALESASLTQELELSSAVSPETAQAEPTTKPVLAEELEFGSMLEQEPELASSQAPETTQAQAPTTGQAPAPEPEPAWAWAWAPEPTLAPAQINLPCQDLLNDMALKIFGDHPDIPKRENALGFLAQKPCAFNEIKPHMFWRILKLVTCFKVGPAAKESQAMKLLKKIWASIEEKPKSEIDTILRGPSVVRDVNRTFHPSRVLFVAVEMGNTKFVVELIRKYPDLIWKQNDNGQSIFHIAVAHRRESIYNLLYEIGSTKHFITCLKDEEGNNMLHLLGKKADKNQPSDVSGVAFQLQRELLWFKEVESMIPPHYINQKNKAGQTPHELFTDTHKDLVSEAEKWMKGTASKCMVASALIATIVFAVAFTIPGGYDQNNGFPMFLHDGSFIVFVVLDAISLILSATSILMFLSILTSRYSQKIFIESLPKKLVVGLTTLFFSFVTMMIAFSVSFFVLYRHKFIPIAIVISVLSLIPIIAYAKLRYSLLVDVFSSMFGSRTLFKPKKGILYYQNPRV